jgi:hypothetical protein
MSSVCLLYSFTLLRREMNKLNVDKISCGKLLRKQIIKEIIPLSVSHSRSQDRLIIYAVNSKYCTVHTVSTGTWYCNISSSIVNL